MQKPPNQRERVLDWLKQGKTLTRYEALTELGIFELSARIVELQQQGNKITSKMIKVQNRWGEKCNVASYSLEIGEREKWSLVK